MRAYTRETEHTFYLRVYATRVTEMRRKYGSFDPCHTSCNAIYRNTWWL